MSDGAVNLASYFTPQNRTRLYTLPFGGFRAMFLSCTLGVFFADGKDPRMFCRCVCVWDEENDRERKI